MGFREVTGLPKVTQLESSSSSLFQLPHPTASQYSSYTQVGSFVLQSSEMCYVMVEVTHPGYRVEEL